MFSFLLTSFLFFLISIFEVIRLSIETEVKKKQKLGYMIAFIIVLSFFLYQFLHVSYTLEVGKEADYETLEVENTKIFAYESFYLSFQSNKEFGEKEFELVLEEKNGDHYEEYATQPLLIEDPSYNTYLIEVFGLEAGEYQISVLSENDSLVEEKFTIKEN